MKENSLMEKYYIQMNAIKVIKEIAEKNRALTLFNIE